MAGRWTVSNAHLEGTLFSVGPEKQYGNGQGSLREAVIRTQGPYGEVFVPVTLFGQDAAEVNGKVGCTIAVDVRLIARQYEWNGDIRWSLQYTVAELKLGTCPVHDGEPGTADDGHEADEYANNPAVDDLPF